MKKILTTLALLLCAPAWGQVAFPLFQPSSGIMVGDPNTYITTSATVLDVTGLFTGICDATTFLRGDGECQTPTYAQGANPSAQVGLTAVNGVATTFMRSDAAPGLDVTISPTWMGNHTFTNPILVTGQNVCLDDGTDCSFLSAYPTLAGDNIFAGNNSFDNQILVEGQNVCLADGTDCTVLSGYATLSGNQTFSGQNAFTQQVTVQGTPGALFDNVGPQFRFNETDAAANNRLWQFYAESEQLVFGVRTDAPGPTSPWLTVDRTGTTVDDVTLYAPTEINSPSALLWIYDSDAVADRRTYRMTGASSSFSIDACNDARSSCSNIINASTTGSTPTVSAVGLYGSSIIFPNITTTASAANAFLDSGASNRLYRSTSSIRYKKDVEAIEAVEYDKLRNLRPITYHSKAEADDPNRRWFGLIAEEVAEVYPELVNYDAEGRPDGVQYERLTVLLLGEIQRLRERVEALENAH